MSVLFFLPWVATNEPVQLGPMRLIPYVRGQEPGTIHGISQNTIDAILGSYGDPAYFPSQATSVHVANASIITWNDDTKGLELPEDRITARLEQANYIAFAALSERRFCSHAGYCNADRYQVIAQRFTEDRPGATTLMTRRRDGHGQHYVGDAPVPRFIRPHHVDSFFPPGVDAGLVAALCALPAGGLKDRLDEAIDAFLRANTDSPSMRERSEMILMRVAFETLLDSTHETGDLRQRFRGHFQGEVPEPPVWSAGQLDETRWRARWPKNVERPLDAWLQDFCAARNSAAHGPRGTREPPLWQRHNHLLLSSWLFPLMVKKTLATEDLYQLSPEDEAARRSFEKFLGHDLLSYVDEDGRSLWWSRVESEILLPVVAARIFTGFE
jgi:hypothetical protein